MTPITTLEQAHLDEGSGVDTNREGANVSQAIFKLDTIGHRRQPQDTSTR